MTEEAIGDWTLEVVGETSTTKSYHEWTRVGAPETKIEVCRLGFVLAATGTPFRSLSEAMDYADEVLMAQGRLTYRNAVVHAVRVCGSVTTFRGDEGD
jgi:hypothetical protein